jgi:hypothetical protein
MPDKQVRVTIGVDETSAAKAKRVISEITAEVNRLVAATHQINLGFGGGGGGGGFGARVGSFSPGSGVSARSQLGQRMSQAGGGVTDGLARAVQNSAALFKGAAQGSKDSFKIMSDSLKRHVDDSDREIRRLTGSLEKLEKQYDRLKTRQASGLGGRLTAGAMESVQGRYYDTLGQLDTARSTSGKLVKARTEIEDQALGPLKGPQTILGRAGGFLQQQFGNLKQAGGEVAGALGLPPGLLTGKMGPFAAMGAGYYAGTKLVQTGRSNEVANVDYDIAQPFYRMNAKAAAGSIYGGNALSIRHGDLARSIAIARLSQDKGMKDVQSVNMDRLLERSRDLAHPDTWLGMMSKNGIFGGSKDYLMGKAGGLVSGIAGGSPAGTMDVNTLGRTRAEQEQQSQRIEMFQKALDAKMQEDPTFNDRVNRLYQGSIGDLGLSRAAGISGGLTRLGKGGPAIDSVSLLKATAMGAGYDPGEWVGAMQQMAGTAGRGFLHRGTHSLLSAQSGGLGNAAQLLGVGAQFNGGGFAGGQKFLGGIQGGIGRGGVDVTAGAQVLNTGMGMMTAGNFSGGGSGLMSTLLDATFTGSTGGDMRAARTVQGGLGAEGAMMSGGIDPLQKALNASAAMQAAPNAPIIAKDALMNMDPATMAEFMRTKQVPVELASVGVTKEMMEKYVSAQNRTAFARVTDRMTGGEGTATGAAVERYRKSGGLGYLKGQSREDVDKEIGLLAPGLKFAGGASSLDDAKGRLLFEAATQGVRRGGRGRGAHESTGAGTARMTAAGSQALFEAKEGFQNAADDKVIKTATNAMIHTESRLEDARKESIRAMSSGDPSFAIKGVAEALTNFVTSIRHMIDGSHLQVGGAGPKKTSVVK